MGRQQGLQRRHLEWGTHKAEYRRRLMEGRTLTLFILSLSPSPPPPLSLTHPTTHPPPPHLKQSRTALMCLTIYVDG